MKKYRVSVNGRTYEVIVEEIEASCSSMDGSPGATLSVGAQPEDASPAAPAVPPGAELVTAPMPGKVLSLKVKQGQQVKEGELILILEAMKMENEIFCGRAGRVLEIRVSEGDHVNADDALVVIG